MTTPVYHITHIDNLPGITSGMGLSCDNEMKKTGNHVTAIAYEQLKERRMKTPVPVEPGGTLADYVPFYFTNRSPMLYAIHTKYVDDYHDGQEGIIYLVASVEKIAGSDLGWCFTDGHAVEAITTFFNDPGQLKAVDWSVIRNNSWGNSMEYPDRKRKKQAEFLVKRFFPWNMVEKIGVYDTSIQKRVQEIIGGCEWQPPVEVRKYWYY